jgi:hypothetical protein
MSETTDRSAYLDDFVNGGFVGNLSELNGLSEDEFRQLVTAIHGGADFEARPAAAAPGGEAFGALRKQTLEERILLLKIPAGAFPIPEALEDGRRLGRRFLDAYAADARPRVIGSPLASLR